MTELATPVAGLGRPRARGWIHLYSAVAATVMSLALIPLAAVFVGVGRRVRLRDLRADH